MSILELKERLTATLLEFCWDEWAQLGVFASSDADLAIIHRICVALTATPRLISPTDFHNSVKTMKDPKAVSAGNYDAELPKQWAEDHIVANVQKLLSGKWMLYESYGYKEIAELK